MSVMKTAYRFVLVLLLTFTSVTAANAQTRVVHSPSDGYLNLRTGPSTRYAIIQRMYNGTKVDVIGRSGSWRKVELWDGTRGWAHKNYLRSPSSSGSGSWDSPGTLLVVYSRYDGYLNLRTGPSSNYAIIQRMYNGTEVEVLGSKGKWREVLLWDGTSGWAHRSYMQRVSQ